MIKRWLDEGRGTRNVQIRREGLIYFVKVAEGVRSGLQSGYGKGATIEEAFTKALGVFAEDEPLETGNA